MCRTSRGLPPRAGPQGTGGGLRAQGSGLSMSETRQVLQHGCREQGAKDCVGWCRGEALKYCSHSARVTAGPGRVLKAPASPPRPSTMCRRGTEPARGRGGGGCWAHVHEQAMCLHMVRTLATGSCACAWCSCLTQWCSCLTQWCSCLTQRQWCSCLTQWCSCLTPWPWYSCLTQWCSCLTQWCSCLTHGAHASRNGAHEGLTPRPAGGWRGRAWAWPWGAGPPSFWMSMRAKSAASPAHGGLTWGWAAGTGVCGSGGIGMGITMICT